MEGPLARLGCERQGNIRVDLKQIGWEEVHWVHLTEDKNQ
jgi:hypothetical protein